jgi:hypothetical protein
MELEDDEESGGGEGEAGRDGGGEGVVVEEIVGSGFL